MPGIVYVCCTPVGRYIIKSHLKHHPQIPIAGIINLVGSQAINKSNYDNLYDVASDNDIPIYYCNHISAMGMNKKLEKLNPDLIIQSGWSQKFGEEILSIPKHGCIGQHPSPLPVGRGAACVNWALLEGRKEWGNSFFQMVEEYDKGSVYAQKEFIIESYDNVKTVYDKVGFTSYEIIRDKLSSWYHGFFKAMPIDEAEATHYAKRKPEDGELDFTWSDVKIYNYVRALTKPYPGAFFNYQGRKIFVWDAVLLNEITDIIPGVFSTDGNSRSLLVSTGNGKVISFKRLQKEGLPEFYGHEFFDVLELV